MSVIVASTQPAWAWAPGAAAPGAAAPAPTGVPATPSPAPAAAPTPAPGYPPSGSTGYPPPPPAAGYPPSYAPSYPPVRPPGAAAQPSRPGFPPIAGPTVQLITDNSRARLQQQFQLRWTDVCAAPCGIAVNPAATYRVGGGSLRATAPFTMPRSSGPVLVDAKMGSNVKHWVGVGLTIAGGVNLLGGAVYLIAAQNATGTIGDVSKKDYFTVYGVVGLVIGAVLTGIGIPLLVGGSSSAEVR